MENDGVTCLVMGLWFLVLLVVGLLLAGWVLSILWGWFVVPIFNVENLTIVQAIGLSLVFDLFASGLKAETVDEKDPIDKMLKSAVRVILTPLFFLFIGWIVQGLL